jgi:hypothetical protein
MVLAVDLADMFDAAGVRHRLQEARALIGKHMDLDKLTKVITSVQGLRLRVQVDQAVRGELQVDFGEEVAPMHAVAKPLLLEALAGAGVMLDELDKWQVHVERKAVYLRGKPTDTALRQLLSFIPGTSVESRTAASSGDEPQDPKAVASLRYYHTITTYLGDLRKNKTQTYSQAALFLDKYAQKIDSLPMLNVDEELLQYGMAVSSMLRSLGQSARGTGILQGTLKQYSAETGVNIPGSYYAERGYGYGYAYYNPSQFYIVNNYPQIKQAMDKTSLTEAQGRLVVWKQIDELTVAMRKKMTQKYQVEFK